MEKGLKRIVYLLIFAFVLLLPSTKLKAISGYVSVNTDKYTAVVGSYVNVSVTFSSDVALGSLSYSISYDSSKLELTSGNAYYVDYGNGSDTSKTYYFTFYVKASGTSTISVSGVEAYAYWEEELLGLSVGSATVTGITQEDLQASYSTNNNLASLSINGYSLTPEFNKDTLEYSVSVPSNTEKITLDASVEDRYATLTGTGEFNVSEGDNKFEIVVTAENGSTKTYTVKVTVEDENPIKLRIDGLDYTVVKRESSLTMPSTFEKTTLKINGVEVPGFISKITNYKLVGLKDKNGKISLFIYDEKNNKYTLYTETKSEGITLFIKEPKGGLNGFTKTKIKINKEEITAYRYAKTNLYVVYGVNIENNEEGYFVYDKKNNSFTAYDSKIIDELVEKNNNFLMIIIVLGVETILLLLVVLITLSSKKNKKKALKQELNNQNKDIIKTEQNNIEQEKIEKKDEKKKNKEEKK